MLESSAGSSPPSTRTLCSQSIRMLKGPCLKKYNDVAFRSPNKLFQPVCPIPYVKHPSHGNRVTFGTLQEEEEAEDLGVASSTVTSRRLSVIAHLDLDAFYAQVERGRDPSLRGVPTAVVQYNPHGDLATFTPDMDRRADASNGSLIAVSYEARAKGVKRVMRGDKAREVCPDLRLVRVPTAHGKADLTIYREAGARVVSILSRWALTERASIDEAYVDLTNCAEEALPKWGEDMLEKARRTVLAGGSEGGQVLTRFDVRMGHSDVSQGKEGEAEMRWWQRPAALWSLDERKLACGAAIMSDMRAKIFEELGYTCSAGIAPNKLLAKLASGMHKPDQQTLVIPEMIPILLNSLPIARIKGFGGEFGDRMQADLNINTIGELVAVPLTRLEALYGSDSAQWVWKLARGLDEEKVQDRQLPKSVSCGKTFYGRNAIRTLEDARKWLMELTTELVERLQADARLNSRFPQLLTVHWMQQQSAYRPPKPPAEPTPGLKKFENCVQVSRSAPFRTSLDALDQRPDEARDIVVETSLGLVRKWMAQQDAMQPAGKAGLDLRVITLFVNAGNFLKETQKSRITTFFGQSTAPRPSPTNPPTAGSNDPAAASDPASTPHRPVREHDTASVSGAGRPSPSPLPFRFKRPLPTTEDCGEGNEAGPAASEEHGQAKWRALEPVTPSNDPCSLPVMPASPVVTPTAVYAPKHLEQSDTPTSPSAPPVSRSTSVAEVAAASTATPSTSGDFTIDPRDIDPAVLQELPFEIRREVLAAQRNSAMQKPRTIKGYFAQAKGQKVKGGGDGKSKAKKGSLDMYFKQK